MATIFQTTDITNSSTFYPIFGDPASSYVTIASGDEVYVAQDVFVGATYNLYDVNGATSLDLNFLGSGATNGNGIRMDISSGDTEAYDFNYRVYIGADATIVSLYSVGFFGILTTGAGVRQSTSSVEFVNEGNLASTNGSGLTFQSAGRVNFTNTGSLSSSDYRSAVKFANIEYATLINTGEITNTTQNTTAHYSATVYFATNTENSLFVNTGELVSLDYAYYSTSTDSEVVQNSGTIHGHVLMSASTDSMLENTGLIVGNVDTRTGFDIIDNAGTIQGDVDLGGSGDTLNNTGVITGDVDLGSGDDIYRAGGSGLVAGSIYGGTGHDAIAGGEADEYIDGGSENDTIRGNGGEDELLGDAGADKLIGGADNDTIYGGDDNDTVRGDDGNDVLLGDDGNDKMYGGAGDDEITGGEGKDVMRGNGGADTFIFASELDANTSTAVDRIRDFELGVDKIDISLITTFTFVGSSGFSGTGSEVRYQTTNSGLRFEMDVDGDGNVDMRVNMNGVSDLQESDFIL